MSRMSKRPMTAMFSSAFSAQEGETVAQLKEELESLKSLSSTSFKLPVKDIQPLQLPHRLKQPRLYFDPQKMERLKDSIQKHGVLEPILVRPSGKGKYEIISGERRWRSCCALKKDEIPAVIRDMPDVIALEAALVAHLLNEEISSIEQTESILNLLSLNLDVSVDDVKAGLYRVKNANVRGTENSRIFNEEELTIITNILGEFDMKLSSFVSNRLPLLNLAPDILDAVRAGKLSPTNAVLLNRQRPELHEELIEQAEGLTKKDVMALVKEVEKEQAKPVSEAVVMSDKLFARFKAVRKNRQLIESSEVQKRLNKISILLEEIENLQ